MVKEEIYDYLKSKNIDFEVTNHQAVFSMDELSQVNFPYQQCYAKNLFVTDSKKTKYFLITVKGSKRVDLKEFRANCIVPTSRLSFASPQELFEKMELLPGSVSPFGLLNSKDKNIIFYIDEDFWLGNKKIGIHPNINTATVWLNVDDLVKIIKEKGFSVYKTKL